MREEISTDSRREDCLKVEFAGLKLQNPVLTASGTFGYGLEYAPFMDLNKLGGIIVKGLSLEPRIGNPPPRLVETASGLLNSIGLQNIGLKAFLKDKLPQLRTLQTKVIVNIFGNSIEEYSELAKALDGTEGISALEANISCPNVKEGGMLFGSDPRSTYEVLGEVRKNTTFPLIAKLSPNVTDIRVIARAAVEAGADALSLINTLLGMAIDVKTRKAKLSTITGGLSGPAIKPVALRVVWQVAHTVKVPIIGLGGIMDANDALEFILAGATAIQVGTASFIDPASSLKIVEGLQDYCYKHKVSHISSLIGGLET